MKRIFIVFALVISIICTFTPACLNLDVSDNDSDSVLILENDFLGQIVKYPSIQEIYIDKIQKIIRCSINQNDPLTFSRASLQGNFDMEFYLDENKMKTPTETELEENDTFYISVKRDTLAVNYKLILTRKPKNESSASTDTFTPPDVSLKEGAAHWYEVADMMAGVSSKQKAANLMIYTSYNHINVKEFYCAAHVDTNSENKYTCSDYYRTKQGANMFYETFAYTGSLNMAQRRLDYVDQRVNVTSTGVTYDRNSKVYTTSWGIPSTENKEVRLPDETPYVIYSWFDIPLDFGSRKNAYNEIDASLIDSVTITNPTESKPYYVLEFTTDGDKVNASDETLRRLNEGTGGKMKNIEVLDLSFTAEIWPSGLFRSITVRARVEASISGKGAGEATIDRTYQFSYDPIDCSVAKKFEDNDLTKELSAENQQRIKDEVALLPSKEKSSQAQ